MKTIKYSKIGSEYEESIVIDKIVRLSKSYNGTYIHLINGDILHSSDSINTLDARINATN